MVAVMAQQLTIKISEDPWMDSSGGSPPSVMGTQQYKYLRIHAMLHSQISYMHSASAVLTYMCIIPTAV